MIPSTSVDSYIEKFPDEVHKKLYQIRKLLKKNAKKHRGENKLRYARLFFKWSADLYQREEEDEMK